MTTVLSYSLIIWWDYDDDILQRWDLDNDSLIDSIIDNAIRTERVVGIPTTWTTIPKPNRWLDYLLDENLERITDHNDDDIIIFSDTWFQEVDNAVRSETRQNL